MQKSISFVNNGRPMTGAARGEPRDHRELSPSLVSPASSPKRRHLASFGAGGFDSPSPSPDAGAVALDSAGPVLVRVPTWRRVKNVKHVYRGESWNASIKPSHHMEPLSTTTFERHVKLAALEVDESSGLTRTRRGAAPKATGPRRTKSRGALLGPNDADGFVEVEAPAVEAGGLQKKPSSRRMTAGAAPYFGRARTAEKSALRRNRRPPSRSMVATPVSHSLRSAAGYGRGQEWRPRTGMSRRPGTRTKTPGVKAVKVTTNVAVATSYVPWSPVHKAPTGQWNKSRKASPALQVMSNDAYVRRLGEAVMSLPAASNSRAAGWRRQMRR